MRGRVSPSYVLFVDPANSGLYRVFAARPQNHKPQTILNSGSISLIEQICPDINLNYTAKIKSRSSMDWPGDDTRLANVK